MCFTTLLPNTMIFFVEKNERNFCAAKAAHIFSTTRGPTGPEPLT